MMQSTVNDPFAKMILPVFRTRWRCLLRLSAVIGSASPWALQQEPRRVAVGLRVRARSSPSPSYLTPWAGQERTAYRSVTPGTDEGSCSVAIVSCEPPRSGDHVAIMDLTGRI